MMNSSCFIFEYEVNGIRLKSSVLAKNEGEAWNIIAATHGVYPHLIRMEKPQQKGILVTQILSS